MENPLDYDGPIATVLDLAKRTQGLVRRWPVAADTLLAVAMAAAILVSLAATYEGLPATYQTFSHGFTPAVVASMLALTLPLAWRRRYPFSVAFLVVVAFLVAKIVVQVPEINVSLFAWWVASYSAAVYGERRFRTPVLALCYSAIMAEFVRETYFAPYSNGPPLARIFTLLNEAIVVALLWATWCRHMVVARSSTQAGRSDHRTPSRARGERPASRVHRTGAYRPRFARRRGPPRERDRGAGRRCPTDNGTRAGKGRRSIELDRRFQSAGRRRASSPPRVPSPRWGERRPCPPAGPRPPRRPDHGGAPTQS